MLEARELSEALSQEESEESYLIKAERIMI